MIYKDTTFFFYSCVTRKCELQKKERRNAITKSREKLSRNTARAVENQGARFFTKYKLVEVYKHYLYNIIFYLLHIRDAIK